MVNENISAISTPAGCGGVAIIRISGATALDVAAKMFVPTAKVNVKDFTPNYMYTGKILADGFQDFGMCVYFKGPKSFTGEDVVELHCHGGIQISRGILKATFANGCRSAERGEFTKRAFLNGKLSLSSAEGMIDMINAESMAEVRAGSMLYAESLTKKLAPVQTKLTDILAGIAADIDYPEEDVEATSLGGVKDELLQILDTIKSLSQSYEGGRKIKQGVTVALCGRPNVGKSSLLNAILGYDKAIVSSIAGTTRDAVEGVIELDGVKCNLVDTAGLREKADDIEAIGIQKAKSILSSADVVLYVDDGTSEQTPDVDLSDKRVIKVGNKCDICAYQLKNYDVLVSAKTGEGLDKLKALISQKALGDNSLDKAYIIEERHFAALKKAENCLQNAIAGIGNYPLDLISLDINEAWSALGEITGETANESIINTVFAKFCVGK
jgi:tRNA modification GTPase